MDDQSRPWQLLGYRGVVLRTAAQMVCRWHVLQALGVGVPGSPETHIARPRVLRIHLPYLQVCLDRSSASALRLKVSHVLLMAAKLQLFLHSV